MKKASQDSIVQTTDDISYSPGVIVDSSLRLVRSTGKAVGVSSKMLTRVSGAVKQSGKKIAGFGEKSVAAAKDLLGQSVGDSALVTGPQVEPVSKTATPEAEDEQMTNHKRALKALVAALESNLAEVRCELEKTRSHAEYVQSQFESQLKQLQSEKESLVSELKKVHRSKKDTSSQSSSKVSTTKKKPGSLLPNEGTENTAVALTEPEPVSSTGAVVEADQKSKVIAGQNPVQAPVAEAKAPMPVEVTLGDVDKADWPNVSEKIIFTKALSDIAGQDTALRTDAVRTIATVRHELSVRALSAQMARESSPRVRQECIKALMALKMPEGAAAVEHALTDRVASVRLAAVQALYRLTPAQSAPALVRMFYDEDEDVRRRAVVCVGWLGEENLATELLPLLNDNSISVKRAVIEAMANLRSRQVVSTLIEHLNDPVESIRKAVVSTLKTITGKKMSGPFPKGQKSLQRLIVRWQQWWKEQQPQ
ncbi:MAG: HEAT repeat domain-containing protein [Planctomycetota bacterium]|jgi:hypothetical protein